MHKPIRSSWQNLGSENGNTSSLSSSLKKLPDNIKRTNSIFTLSDWTFLMVAIIVKEYFVPASVKLFLGSSAWEIDQFGQPGIGWWVVIALSKKSHPLWQLKKRKNLWWEFTLIACYLWTIGNNVSMSRVNNINNKWSYSHSTREMRETSQRIIGPNTPFMLSFQLSIINVAINCKFSQKSKHRWIIHDVIPMIILNESNGWKRKRWFPRILWS